MTNYYGIGRDRPRQLHRRDLRSVGQLRAERGLRHLQPVHQFGGENFGREFRKDKDNSRAVAVCFRHTPYDRRSAHQRWLTWREYAQDTGNDAHRDGTVMTPTGPACGHPKLDGSISLTRPVQRVTVTRRGTIRSCTSSRSLVRRVTVTHTYCRCRPLPATEERRHDAELLVRHTQHVPRRSRLAQVPGRDAGTPAAGRRVLEGVDTADHGVACVPADGLILITFDESGDDSNAGACCGEIDSLGFTDRRIQTSMRSGCTGRRGTRGSDRALEVREAGNGQ